MTSTTLLISLAVSSTIGAAGLYTYRFLYHTDHLAHIDRRLPRIPGTESYFGFIPLFLKSKDGYKNFKDFIANYGSLAVTHVFGTPALCLGTPEHIKEFLALPSAKNKGRGGYENLKVFLGARSVLLLPYEAWQPLRRTLASVFHLQNMKGYFSLFVEASRDLVQRIEEASQERARRFAEFEARGLKFAPSTLLTEVNIDSFTTDFALDIVTRALFSKNLAIQKSDTYHMVEKMVRLSELFAKVNRNPFFSLMHPFLKMEYNSLVRWFHGFVREWVEERKRLNEAGGESKNENDLLGLMLKTTDPETGKMMTTEEIVHQCTTFYFAGHDTTAHTIAWCLYEIARHPEVEEKVHEELERVLGDKEYPTLEDVNKLTYVQWVAKETLRIHPPVGSFTRMIEAESELDGVRVPEKTVGIVSVVAIQKSELFWPEPWRFRPERFSEEESANRPQNAWIPFASGERNCVGMSFALLEIRTALAVVCKKYFVRPSVDRLPHTKSTLTAVPADGIYVSFIKRAPE